MLANGLRRLKRVLLFKKEVLVIPNEIDKRAGIKILTRWFKVAARNSIKWSSITTEWKNASTELTSTMFWQQYLGLKHPIEKIHADR